MSLTSRTDFLSAWAFNTEYAQGNIYRKFLPKIDYTWSGDHLDWSYFLSSWYSHSVLLESANLELMLIFLPLVSCTSQSLHDLVTSALKPDDRPTKEGKEKEKVEDHKGFFHVCTNQHCVVIGYVQCHQIRRCDCLKTAATEKPENASLFGQNGRQGTFQN